MNLDGVYPALCFDLFSIHNASWRTALIRLDILILECQSVNMIVFIKVEFTTDVVIALSFET